MAFYKLLALPICLLMAYNVSNVSKERLQTREMFIFFIQSDLDPQSLVDKENFNMIWGKIMPEILLKICDRQDAVCLFYPLNEDTKGAHLLRLELNLKELHNLTDYHRKRFLNKSMETYKRLHANRMANLSSYQDILSSYSVLKDLPDNFPNDTRVTMKVIFISDMVHYTSTGETTDAEKGIFNFAYEYSLNMFLQNLGKGILHDGIKLEPVFTNNSQHELQIFSIFLSRGDDREEISSSIINKLNSVWREFFSKMGAKRIRLKLKVEFLDQIFSPS